MTSDCDHRKLLEKDYDPVTFDFLRVKPDDFASQLTLIDLRIFKAISIEELFSGDWSKKSKRLDAPTVVSFTDRFNSVCLWCQREVLSHANTVKRAEVISRFIKIANRLFQLNNLNSTFAIISALQSHPIYRLSKTWGLIGRHDRTNFQKVCSVFDSNRNWELLRQRIGSLKLPCIPHLGLYLTDLTFIDVAYRRSEHNFDGSRMKDQKKNNIIRQLVHFQESVYDNILYIDCLQKYLETFQFHEELLKFVEDDLYKQSIALEADTQVDNSKLSALDFFRRTSLSKTFKAVSTMRANRSAIEFITKSFTPQLHTKNRLKHESLHRRARSLDTEIGSDVLKLQMASDLSFSNIETFDATDSSFSPCGSKSKLNYAAFLDDSLDTDQSCRSLSQNPEMLITSTPKSRIKSIDHKTKHVFHFHDLHYSTAKKCDDSDRIRLIGTEVKHVDYEGEATLVVIRKRGSKPASLHCPRKCYLEFQSPYLYHFWRRTTHILYNDLRERFCQKSSKQKLLGENEWRVIKHVTTTEPSFELHHPKTGRIHRYICKSETIAAKWCEILGKTFQCNISKTPVNLISLD